MYVSRYLIELNYQSLSSVTSMLDIIQDWATELKRWKVCRIDGVTRQESRREQMKEFNEGQGPNGKTQY